jgi:hypothetical protein
MDEQVAQSAPIKMTYYFIKDKVGQGEITIEHCPTDQMWTDINRKPKQGLVFRVFRGHVMGIPADYRDSDYEGKVPLSPKVSMLPLTKEQPASQECVGGEAKGLERAPIKPMHASGNACVSRRSDATGNACVSRRSIRTRPLTDRRRKSGSLWTWWCVRCRASLSEHQSK